MSDIEVTVSGFGGSQTLTIPQGSSVEIAANGAGVAPDAVVRLKGERITPDARDSTTVEDGDVLVATPPEGKQGA